MLERGDQVPHFAVSRRDGSRFSYQDIWQRKNLLLVSLPPGTSADVERYAAQFDEYATAFATHNTECVITSDSVSGLRAPGVLIADRWGEAYLARQAPAVANLPTPVELVEWLEYVQQECPECQGEAR